LTSKNVNVNQFDHLNPEPPSYSSQPFVDACTLRIASGGGGHGCISFLREMFIDNGPPNGGDGGSGGSVYIQAVRGETSLHKIARRGTVAAGRGKNGMGKMRGGGRGEDVLLTVPVGTVVREVTRYDPVIEEERLYRESRRRKRRAEIEAAAAAAAQNNDDGGHFRRDRWLIYPGFLPRAFSTAEIPAVPRPRRSSLFALQPASPFCLNLDAPMDAPMLLAAGAMGGLGNPHFITKTLPKPKFALKGDDGMRIDLHLELKILADVGLVGLPNAGKSTLLRAITRSRTRIGDWAFTTLQPNIGTVVLDSYAGRPTTKGRTPRTNFTIADIPGLIEGAHLDRGLGLGFLRHIERAAVLAFVVDLSAGDAVQALKGLWHEVGQYERLRDGRGGYDAAQPLSTSIEPDSSNSKSKGKGLTGEQALLEALKSQNDAAAAAASGASRYPDLPQLILPPISSKPWFVIATKADLPETQERFTELQTYLAKIQNGEEEHPCRSASAHGKADEREKIDDPWRKRLQAVPVSAISKQGVEGLPQLILELLDED
jgi:GTP-binding protein